MDLPSIILSLLLTAVAYMAFPLIKLFINAGRFARKRAHKIALWNSIVLGAVFCITTIAVSEGGTVWNGAPAFLYYWINRSILTDKNATEKTPSEERIIKSQKRKKSVSRIFKGIGAFLLGVISSEILLLITLGNLLEGTAALLFMLLVSIPFFAFYYRLFTRHDKNKSEKSNKPVIEDVSSCPIPPAHTSRSPQISYANEEPKTYGNYNVYGSEIALSDPPAPKTISFCRKCGFHLTPDSCFCSKCGTAVIKE